MSRHVSADVLARYREDDLSSRKAARIRAHLTGCTTCTGTDSDLASVSGLLAATYPPPMPERLADRVQLAIARESAARAAGTPVLASDPSMAEAAGETGPARIPGRPDLPERSGRRAGRLRMPNPSSPLLLRGLAAAGAVVIVAGAGYLLASGQTASTSSTAGSAAPKPSAQRNSAARIAMNPQSLHYRRNGAIAIATAVASDVNFTPGSLAAQVRRQVASSSPKFATGSPAAAPNAEKITSFGGISIPKLEGCLTRVAAGRKVLLADVARYLGKPATIIVLQSMTAGNVFHVAIVGLACSASNADIITQAEVARAPAG